MTKHFFLGLSVHAMPGVRSADTHQYVILWREIRDNVPLPFTPVLAPNDDVHQLRHSCPIETQPTCNACQDILRYAASRLDHHIRILLEGLDLSFRLVCSDRVVRGHFTELALTTPISLSEVLKRSRQMYVDHNRPVRFPDGVDLLLDAYRINDDGRSFILLPQSRFEPLRNPSTPSLVIVRLPGLLESSSF